MPDSSLESGGCELVMTARSGGALNTTEFAGGELGGRKDNIVGGVPISTGYAEIGRAHV